MTFVVRTAQFYRDVLFAFLTLSIDFLFFCLKHFYIHWATLTLGAYTFDVAMGMIHNHKLKSNGQMLKQQPTVLDNLVSFTVCVCECMPGPLQCSSSLSFHRLPVNRASSESITVISS